MALMSSGRSFYITTPIFYVNDVPHIGHAYNEVACDVLARWHRQGGDDTWLLTGTDEHGQKILRTATAHDTSPKEWVDRLVESAWKPLLKTLNIANDDFIRTTDERHEEGVRIFLQRLYDAGYIYAGEFEALYCVGCEEFKPESEIVDGTGEFEGQKVCAIHSKPLELLSEKNYFFSMSQFAEPLLEYYAAHPDFIQPDSARNEVVSFVQSGLKDLSISRSSFDWGIKVPWDESHVVYVWFDALLNYVTAVGYDADPDEFARRWPAALHMVGKDILRFHAVIWPAMLMAAGLPIPEKVFGHGWLLVGGEKMSKSKATGIAPSQITDVFGTDAFRYYFMRAITLGSDGSFSWEDIHARYHAELANGLGNLGSRVIAMVQKYFDGQVPVDALDSVTEPEQALADLEQRVTREADAAIERIAPHEAIAVIWELVDALNGYVTEQEPWALAKAGDTGRLARVLSTLTHGVATLAVLLAPVMPGSMQTLWAAIGGKGPVQDQDVRTAFAVASAGPVHTIPPLFPRVDDDAVPATPVPQA